MVIVRNLSNILLSDILIFSSRSFYDDLSILGVLKFYSNLSIFYLMLPGTWSKFSSIIYLIISSSALFALFSLWNSYKLVVGLLGLIFCFIFSLLFFIFLPYSVSWETSSTFQFNSSIEINERFTSLMSLFSASVFLFSECVSFILFLLHGNNVF